MADSIQAMGILQNLIGAELPDGTIGIVGGEGRRRGTGILVMRGVLDADTPFVPVKVLPVEMAVAASMIENGRRKNMHPAEQIIGFVPFSRKVKRPLSDRRTDGLPPAPRSALPEAGESCPLPAGCAGAGCNLP
ncbi:ParB N-terminal domain-containing protein [Enterobacter hormaechei]|uniref:ParB N-terminal domain-containing protein n=1 Tax=Enterobacter hormaechei TaxID=158836 RepID=UPI0034DD4AC0